ncbi:penicillin-insensitive murein endopeptidase [Chromatium weissei]|nr:penicillin-insensitive murein endopeptidase [Chromatium weissei]
MIRRAPALILFNFLIMIAFGAAATPWGEVQTPTAGAPQVIGSVANGCISGARTLPESGDGYVNVRRYRNRFYGHPTLLRFITDLGRIQQQHSNLLMMVGDLSQPRGGLMSSSHRSHQNGLDVDIWLTLAESVNAARQLMDHADDPPSMVRSDGLNTSAYWSANQRFLIETAARQRSVERIFVNPVIKRALCQNATAADRGWLHKVRPWKGHDAHFHVRLACPPGSSQCEAQNPLPSGDGCGEELDWWFTEEARKPKQAIPGYAPPKPTKQPAACRDVLQAP